MKGAHVFCRCGLGDVAAARYDGAVAGIVDHIFYRSGDFFGGAAQNQSRRIQIAAQRLYRAQLLGGGGHVHRVVHIQNAGAGGQNAGDHAVGVAADVYAGKAAARLNRFYHFGV